MLYLLCSDGGYGNVGKRPERHLNHGRAAQSCCSFSLYGLAALPMLHAINPGIQGAEPPVSAFLKNRKQILAGQKILVLFTGSRLEQIPLTAIIVVIVHPVGNLGFHIFKSSEFYNDSDDFLLHMAEETFLRCDIPTVASSGYGLYILLFIRRSLSRTMASRMSAIFFLALLGFP